MIAALRRRLRDSRGISSVEVMVSMMIMATVVMGTAASSSTALRVAASGEDQSDMAAAVQYQIETLLTDFNDDRRSGTDVVGDYTMKWEVTGAEPFKLTLYVYDMSSGSGSTSTGTWTQLAPDSDQAALSPTFGTGTAAADTVILYFND